MAKIPLRAPVSGISMPLNDSPALRTGQYIGEQTDHDPHWSKRAHVLGGDRTVQVMREDADGRMVADGEMQLGSAAIQSADTPAPVERPSGDDQFTKLHTDAQVTDHQAGPSINISRPPDARTPEPLPQPEPRRPAAPAAAVPPQAIPPQPSVTTQAAAVGQPPTYAPPAKSRTQVMLSSPSMGRHRVVVENVAVGPNVVCLFYPTDGSTAIIEPPACDADNPIRVTVNPGKPNELVADCMYGDWTAEVADHLMVVFIRV